MLWACALQSALFVFGATQVGAIGVQCPVPASLPPLLYSGGATCDVAPPAHITFALQVQGSSGVRCAGAAAVLVVVGALIVGCVPQDEVL
jgi:hypothetical protein